MKNRSSMLLSLMMAITLALAAFGLAACGNGGQGAEQDNCYGEDMPVINE